MLTAELDYDLPVQCIATAPADPRDDARLMVVHRGGGAVEHRHVRDLPDLPAEAGGLAPGDLLIFNQTKVLPAAFKGARTATGGQVRGLYLDADHEPDDGGRLTWRVMLEARGALRSGETVTLDGDVQLELIERLGNGRWRARLHGATDTFALLARIGSTPLPPYIRNQRRARHQPQVNPSDADRYNTVFATDAGSVAAPTAALHFTDELLRRLEHKGVRRAMITLHIGLGTFAPVRSACLEDHQMHAEWMTVPAAALAALRRARSEQRRVVPVGTTCVRALESLPDPLPDADYTTRTNLFIQPAADGEPAHRFRFADALMTNFHLPRSTLLALVAALPGVGVERLKQWYRLAIERGYRFYSYGDAMLLL